MNAQRFDVDPATGCWVWNGALTTSGYGHISIGGKTLMAHRVAYALFRGQLFDNLDIDHLCRNRACINPMHMEVVSRATNVRRGLTAKLTAAAITDIRDRYEAGGISQRQLADAYHVCQTTISKVLRRETWADQPTLVRG